MARGHFSAPNSDYEDYDYLKTLETGQMTPNASGRSTFDMDFADIGMNLIPALTSLIGVKATEADIAARNKRTIRNIENQTEAYRSTLNIRSQQLRDLERAAGDKMTSNGLTALQKESRLKAGAAETGGTGTSNTEAIATAEVGLLHANAVVVRSYEVSKGSMMQTMVAEGLNFENAIENEVLGMTSTELAFYETLNAGMSGLYTGLNFMNATQKESFFNTQTKA